MKKIVFNWKSVGDYLLAILPFLVFSVAYWTSLDAVLLNRLPFNADFMYIPAVVDDMLGGKSIDEWVLTPSPYFFPDGLGVGLLYIFSGSIVWSIVVYVLLQGIAIQALFWGLLRRIFPDIKVGHLILAQTGIWLLFFSHFLQEEFNISYWLISQAAHVGVVVNALLFYRVWLWFMQKPIWGRGLTVFGVGILAILSDKIFIVFVILPLFMWVLYLIASRKLDFKALPVRWLIALITVSWGVYKSLDFIGIHIPHPPKHIDQGIWMNLSLILDDLKFIWADQNILTVFIVFTGFNLLISIIPMLKEIRFIKTNAIDSLPLLILWVLGFAIIVGGAIVEALFQGRDCHRYFYVGYLLTTPLIIVYSIRLLGTRLQNVLAFAGVLMSIAFTFTGFTMIRWNGFSVIDRYAPVATQCVDTYLTGAYGVGHYWESKNTTLFSKKGNTVVAVNPDGTPFLHITNRQLFFDYSQPPFTYYLDYEGLNMPVERLDTIFCGGVILIKTKPFRFVREGGQIRIVTD